MTDPGAADRLDWLQKAAEDGSIHTVRISFADRLGAWRGKRIPAVNFLAGTGRPMGFCDGMIVCDVLCEVIEETPFSNFSTGYPDMHVHPDLSRLRPAAWAPGEAWVFGVPADDSHRPLDVAPVRVLQRVVERLSRAGVAVAVTASLEGRLMTTPEAPVDDESRNRLLGAAADALVDSGIEIAAYEARHDPGSFRLHLGPGEATDAAEAVLVSKGALKEVARAAGARAVFMTRTPQSTEPSLLRLRLTISGFPGSLDPAPLARLLGEARALLQPSVNAFKAGPPPEPAVSTTGGGAVVDPVMASAEADPFTVTAVALSSAGCIAAGGSPSARPATGLADAAALLGGSDWLGDWLGGPFVANSVPLLEREAALFEAAVTEWETQRYWGAA